MEFQLLMAAAIGVSKLISGWLETAKELEEAEKQGSVSPELREKARAARMAALAAMEATK